MQEETGTPPPEEGIQRDLETADSKEDPAGLVTVYTEASPEAVESFLQGNFERELPPIDNPRRWYVEHVLERFQPDELRAQGISRQQRVFTTPIPYQGMVPIENRGLSLLAMDVDPTTIYIADGVHISKMVSGLAGIQRVLPLLGAINYDGKPMTQEEFEQRFSEVPERERERLIELSREDAQNYWASVVPYKDYVASEEKYAEPEILMLPETEIQNVKLAKR